MLKAVPTQLTEINQEALDLAEDVLSKVKDGGVVGFSVVLIRRDGHTLTRYTQSIDMHRLISGVTHLLHDLLHNHPKGSCD